MPQPERNSAPRMITPMSVPAVGEMGHLKFPFDGATVDGLVRAALEEDGAFNDITTIATVVTERRARASLVARETGVIAGVPLAVEAFRLLDRKVSIRIDAEDGTPVRAGDSVLFITGHARPVLAAERVALNFLQRLSGIASLTARYVAVVAGTKARILDTRKTTPGWRALEKYAVRAGGREAGGSGMRAAGAGGSRGARGRRRHHARQHVTRRTARLCVAGGRPGDRRGERRHLAVHGARRGRGGGGLDLGRGAHAFGAGHGSGARLRVSAPGVRGRRSSC